MFLNWAGLEAAMSTHVSMEIQECERPNSFQKIEKIEPNSQGRIVFLRSIASLQIFLSRAYSCMAQGVPADFYNLAVGRPVTSSKYSSPSLGPLPYFSQISYSVSSFALGFSGCTGGRTLLSGILTASGGFVPGSSFTHPGRSTCFPLALLPL